MNLMHSCKRAAELLSRRLDEPLGMVDDLLLALHLSMCRNCSEVEKQLAHIHSASSSLLLDVESPDDDESIGPSDSPATGSTG